jgi:hypothetical protein
LKFLSKEYFVLLRCELLCNLLAERLPIPRVASTLLGDP